MSGGTWNYAGPMAMLGDSYYVIQWTTASLYTQPNVHRYNATTGTRIGTMTIQWNSCTTLALAYVSDMTGDGSNTIWTATWNYNYLAKWTITTPTTGAGTMSCQQHWGGGTYRVGGVASRWTLRRPGT